jgi:acetyl esterase/lipase
MRGAELRATSNTLHASGNMPGVPTVPDPVLVAFLKAARYNRIWRDAAAAERHLADRALRPQAYGPPKRLRRDIRIAVSRHRGWPLYEITPRRETPSGTVIYAHGGGWVNEIAVQHWALCARIAAEAACTVLVPIYPLIPVGTAAEVVEGFAELAAERHVTGPVCLAGDSAGGQIALSSALMLRDRQRQTAEQTILISPGLDASLAHPQIPAVERIDPWLARPGVRVFVEYWRGELAMEDPTVSPINGDLRGLGPITLFSGTRDILAPDAARLAGLATSAGVQIDYHERPGLVHVYPLLPTTEGAAARRLIVDQIRTALHPVRPRTG